MKDVFSILTFYVLLSTFNSLVAQTSPYAQNCWTSILWRHQFKQGFMITSDIGYRSFDEFFKQTRQQLGRVMVEKRLNDRHAVGVGYTYFNSYSSSLKSLTGESRSFVQYQFTKINEKSTIGIRVRNEFRYYVAKQELVNRFRTQVSYEQKTKYAWLLPRLFVEGFVTSGSKPIIEQRYSIGNTFKLNATLNLFLFYTLQRQSTILLNKQEVNQHILGVQLQLNTKSNDNE